MSSNVEVVKVYHFLNYIFKSRDESVRRLFNIKNRKQLRVRNNFTFKLKGLIIISLFIFILP